MCCGQANKSNNKAAKQTDVQAAPPQTTMQSPRQGDTGNPVYNQSTTNVVRANELKRNSYHSNHFGGR